MRQRQVRQPVGVFVGVKALLLAALAASLALAGCGDSGGGVIKPESTAKSPAQSAAEKGK